ncbi:MAG: hypothetical protein OXU43_00440 [Gammaproteobacteria bacterium]|nr:hypothetical protein [Gammaproteobacteria bacterium]
MAKLSEFEKLLLRIQNELGISKAKYSKFEEFAEKTTPPNRRKKIIRFILIIFPTLIIGWVIYDSRLIPQFSASTQSKTPEQRTSAPLALALAPPNNGTTRKNVTAEGVAPFEIKTSAGSNYLIKLENISGMKVMDIFVRGGDTIEVSVPLGSYIVKYAVGNTWYGYEHYFGPDTNYNKADEIFHFRQEGNQISGYTITLYPVLSGNLRTSRIKASQF